jgi:hypothetical protein
MTSSVTDKLTKVILDDTYKDNKDIYMKIDTHFVNLGKLTNITHKDISFRNSYDADVVESNMHVTNLTFNNSGTVNIFKLKDKELKDKEFYILSDNQALTDDDKITMSNFLNINKPYLIKELISKCKANKTSTKLYRFVTNNAFNTLSKGQSECIKYENTIEFQQKLLLTHKFKREFAKFVKETSDRMQFFSDHKNKVKTAMISFSLLGMTGRKFYDKCFPENYMGDRFNRIPTIEKCAMPIIDKIVGEDNTTELTDEVFNNKIQFLTSKLNSLPLVKMPNDDFFVKLNDVINNQYNNITNKDFIISLFTKDVKSMLSDENIHSFVTVKILNIFEFNTSMSYALNSLNKVMEIVEYTDEDEIFNLFTYNQTYIIIKLYIYYVTKLYTDSQF